jgi:hypothetical protein
MLHPTTVRAHREARALRAKGALRVLVLTVRKALADWSGGRDGRARVRAILQGETTKDAAGMDTIATATAHRIVPRKESAEGADVASKRMEQARTKEKMRDPSGVGETPMTIAKGLETTAIIESATIVAKETTIAVTAEIMIAVMTEIMIAVMTEIMIAATEITIAATKITIATTETMITKFRATIKMS